METQENLEKIKIGTKEAEKLKPNAVHIVRAVVEVVGEKKSKKVICNVKHPDREELIQISSVKLERNGKLEISGLWFNLDEDGYIKKNSVLANFLNIMKVSDVAGLNGQVCMTVEDENGYLAFKAY